MMPSVNMPIQFVKKPERADHSAGTDIKSIVDQILRDIPFAKGDSIIPALDYCDARFLAPVNLIESYCDRKSETHLGLLR